jgi:hypothetical protein
MSAIRLYIQQTRRSCKGPVSKIPGYPEPMYRCNMLMQSWSFCQRPSCFSTTIFAGLFSTETKGPLSRRDRERESTCLRARARALRRQSSNAERTAWRHLRAGRLRGYRFRRQVVIEPCIVDLVCVEAPSPHPSPAGRGSENVLPTHKFS